MSRPRCLLSSGALSLAALLAASAPANADRAEAQWSAGGVFGVGRMRDESATSAEPSLLSGVSLAVHYGLSNQLDIGAEILAMMGNEPTFSDAMVFVDPGTPVSGDFTRRTTSALLLLGPTWRYGVDWVPVLSLGGGGGIRYRSNGVFTRLQYFPEEAHQEVSFDLAASAKVGMEHRMGKSLTVGAYTTALLAWSPSAPLLPVATFSLGISYVYYPSFEL
jgi:Outer membrane protein beta-barrel domain